MTSPLMNDDRGRSPSARDQARVHQNRRAVRFSLATLIFLTLACCTHLAVAHYLGSNAVEHLDRRIKQATPNLWTPDSFPSVCFGTTIVLSFPAACLAYRSGPRWAFVGLLILMPINLLGIVVGIDRDTGPVSDTELQYSAADQILCVAALLLSMVSPFLGWRSWKVVHKAKRGTRRAESLGR